ncbi:MAG: MBL fold metallo-hydrolase [Oscillospiraceae bacterium]|nr:MBL fold metallo-hydrolase [Oscillospiraceae bacterium]
MENIICPDKYREITKDNIVVRKKVYDWLYILDNVNITYMYLIIGEEKALLFDTGYGFTDFRPLIAEVTDKPLTVVCSHGHDDHVLGCRFYEEAWLSPRDFELCEANNNPVQKGKQILAVAQSTPGFEKLVDEDEYCNTDLAACTFRPLEDGQVFDLGGITLKVYAVPGHTSGSVALYSPEKKAVFSGDFLMRNHHVIYSQSLKISAEPQEFIHGLTRLSELDVESVWPAHGDVPIDAGVIAETREMLIDWANNADYEKEKPKGPPPKNKIFGDPNDPQPAKYYYKNCSLNYHPGHLLQIRTYMLRHGGAVEIGGDEV